MPHPIPSSPAATIMLGALILITQGCGAPSPAARLELSQLRAGSFLGPSVQPEIDSISPETGPVSSGSLVLIRGQGFGTGTKVYMGNFASKVLIEEAVVVHADETTLVIFTPPFFAVQADIAVINTAALYDYRLAAFTYRDPIAPVPPSNPVASPGDALGMGVIENNLFILHPALVESSLSRRFQSGYTRLGAPMPIAGRFDGNPGDTVGWYDSREHRFHLTVDNGPQAVASFIFDFGDASTSWLPLAGDWNGDGVDTIGIYSSRTGEVRLRNSNSSGPADLAFSLGGTNLIVSAFAGDFDGDGIDSVGTYNPATGEVRIRNSNTTGAPDLAYTWLPGLNFTPVVGDWTDSGRDTLGLFDRSTMQVHLKYELSPGIADRIIQYGPTTSTWFPIAGRWRDSATPPAGPGYAWPVSTPQAERINTLNLLQAYVSASSVPNLRSLLVIRNGRLVSEAYFRGTRANEGYTVKSISKSFLSALYGIAQAEGVLPDMNAPISAYLPADYFPEGLASKKARIPLRTLVTMTAGLVYDEKTSIKPMILSDNPAKAVLAAPFEINPETKQEYEPGEKWNYSTGLTIVAADVLERALRASLGIGLDEYAKLRLFDKIGVSISRWDHDSAGVPTGGYEMYFRPRDLARFGQLYLDQGRVGTTQVVPTRWVQGTTYPLFPVPYVRGRYYGGWWWMQQLAGHYVYWGLGYGGQWLAVVPDLNLVLVATSKSDVPWEMDGIQDSIIQPILEKIISGVSP